MQEQSRGTAYRAGRPASERDGSHERGPHFQQLLGVDSIALPLETGVGTEVVEARLRRHHAAFTLDRNQVNVVSPKHVRIGDLELDLDHRDALTEIKKLIWNTVHETTNAPAVFGALEDEDLKSTLEIRYQRNESYYVVIPASLAGSFAGGTALLHLLRRDFPYLGAFLIGVDTGEQVLVMSEARLQVWIREFFRMLRSHV